MKKLTLNETWKLCLKMWKWIAAESKKLPGSSTPALKIQWVCMNGFSVDEICGNCFFCEYDDELNRTCEFCPGKKVDRSFDCCNSNYNYSSKPAAFYKELCRLNKIRSAKKRGKK